MPEFSVGNVSWKGRHSVHTATESAQNAYKALSKT